jgi:Gram-negative porin
MSTLCRKSKLVASVACLHALALASAMQSARAQVVLSGESTQITVEGYANLTGGIVDASDDARDRGARFDGGARVLGRLRLEDWPDLAVRLAAEVNDDAAEVVEASVLLFDHNGRLEIGERPGLPDVLTGYAPNNFQFTSAEFGPASGPSLDPAGRLQTLLLPQALARQLDSLASLGVTAALFDDRSAKILYVSPKKGGWLAGVSYSGDAEDASVAELVQAGLTHETYWDRNVLRWGATYAQGRTDSRTTDLRSLGAGASIVLDDSLMLGIAASYDGSSRLPSVAAGKLASAAWGATVSVNYNNGPWTVGGYYQYATAEGSPTIARNDRLLAFEAGASYRFTTKARIYGAWYRFDFLDDEPAGLSATGHVFVVGVRLTL